ncbi:hypothetical protein Dimus_019618 [Dionaea muscipula]
MESKDPEENYNTENEEGTIATQRRRSRRVSFAETTEVHIFDRDEDYEMPSNPRPSSEDDDVIEVLGLRRSHSEDIVGLIQSREDGDGDGGGDADDEDEHVSLRKSFFRPLESPSPGSTVGSATFNDEDDFFGPVSADFIRPGRLSGSAASDDNHDFTMDSTAFSMQFRSLANSESGGEFKTPTGVSLVSEEKTPDRTTTPGYPGNLMVLTGSKKAVAQSSLHINTKGDVCHSNDMTIEEENPHKYDYGLLSPGLEALVAEGQDVQSVSLHNAAEGLGSTTSSREESMVSAFSLNSPKHLNLKESCDTGVGSPDNLFKRSSHMASSDHIIIDEVNRDIQTPPMDQRAHDFSQNKDFLDCKASASSGIGMPNVLDQRYLAPVVCLEEQFSEVSGINVEDKAMRNKNSNSLRAIESIDAIRNIEVITEIVKDGGLSNQSAADKSAAVTGSTLPSFEIKSSGMKDLEHFLQIKCKKEKLLSGDSDISLPAITLMEKKDKFAATITHDSAFSSEEGLEVKAPTDLELQGGHYVNVKQMDHFGSVQIDGEGAKVVDDLTSEPGNLSSLLAQKHGGACVPSLTINPKGLLCSHEMHDEDMMLVSQETNYGAGNLQTSLTKREVTSGCTVDSNDKSEIMKECLVPGAEDLADESHTEKIPDSDPKQGLSHSQNEELCNLRNNDIPSVKNIVTLLSDEIKKKHVTHAFDPFNNISLKSFDVYNDDDNSKLKRKFGDLVHGADNHVNEISLLMPGPKFQKIQNCTSESRLVCPVETNEVALTGGKDLTLRHWTEVFSSFCELTKQILPHDVNAFDLQMTGNLENALVQFRKVQNYEILCSDILIKRASNHIGFQGKRVADTRLLLLRTMYAKARLQLLSLTRKKLLSLVQSLHSGIKESEKLRSKCWQGWFVPDQLHAHGRHSGSCAVELDENEVVAHDKIAKMRQALAASEQKIKMLTESYWANVNLKEDSSNFETLVSIKNHLKRRESCQYLWSELQPWKFENLEFKNNKHVAVLSYGDFFFHRFEINFSPASGVTVSNKLNESKILKTFPNIDALAAFSFILSGEIHIKFADPRTSAQATQRSSSLLHNLMDVLEEVQSARMELRNLTHTSFYLPSGKLYPLLIQLVLGLSIGFISNMFEFFFFLLIFGVSNQYYTLLRSSLLWCMIFSPSID